MAYCPRCISFGEECQPDPEDYQLDCAHYKEDPDLTQLITDPIGEPPEETSGTAEAEEEPRTCACCGEIVADEPFCGDPGTSYEKDTLCERCYYEAEPEATIFFDDEDQPNLITAARNETEGTFQTAWHKTDAWRGYYELQSTEYTQLFTDAILSYHESEVMLKNLYDKLTARLKAEGIRFARAFCRTSNVFSTGLEIWVENSVEAVMIATLILYEIKREVNYDDPLYKTGILFSREALGRFKELLGPSIQTDADVMSAVQQDPGYLIAKIQEGR